MTNTDELERLHAWYKPLLVKHYIGIANLNDSDRARQCMRVHYMGRTAEIPIETFQDYEGQFRGLVAYLRNRITKEGKVDITW